MALSVLLQSPPKWIVFRFVALNRVAKRIRHLAPTLQHLSSENSARDPGNQDVDQILDEFWVFKVEDAVFKVHASLLRLEVPSPHRTWLPVYDSVPSSPVILSETAENFRYFLWDLQAFPYEVSLLEHDDLHTASNITSRITALIDRLLNIAETAQRHHLLSLESRSRESLCDFVLSQYFHCASPTQRRRILNIAVRPVSTSLQSQTDSDNLLLHAFSRRIKRHRNTSRQPDPALAQSASGKYGVRPIQKATDIDAAKQSFHFLVPPLPSYGCRSHPACLDAWAQIWAQAAGEALQTPPSPLPRPSIFTPSTSISPTKATLHLMTPILQRLVAATPLMSVQCGLDALEAFNTVRDGLEFEGGG
ncbi:hypothetical protein C8J57DRAFT_251604 [Mycena rebaudengoi]|nr:hypothetical protein C8J57DRAFT_251604 [Mycena rebaudengoi]